ncbi:MAG: hypothetical protein R2798_14150 [Chitinophagales bacterium]|nr:hypothetical protein [Bacteroidota bacterium]MCB9043432.1 hypothetical protein [Chitinophagales bacterium]
MNLSPIQNFKIWGVFLLMVGGVIACKKDDNTDNKPQAIDYGYVIEIQKPQANTVYHWGDTLFLAINFLSETQEYVHNVRVEIQNETNESLYAVQTHVHVPEKYNYADYLWLNDTVKLEEKINWYCKAAVWSHETNAVATIDSLFFQIIP